MTCQSCTHWNLRHKRSMSSDGMAVCNLGPVWTVYPPTHKCNEYRAAPADVVSKRVEWLEKK